MKPYNLERKEFNLERAIEGEPIITRDGHAAKLLMDNAGGKYHLIAAYSEMVDGTEQWIPETYNKAGLILEGQTSGNDLFMHSKKEGWINIYLSDDTIYRGIYEDEGLALANSDDGVVDTIKIEWDE